MLRPGVYEYINIAVGPARFEPGVYIIRGRNPLTGIALSITGIGVQAEGVMFYITDSASYSASTGLPDAVDSGTPPSLEATSAVPNVLIALLLGTEITGIADPGSPFDGMVIYQRRSIRRPILIVGQQILASPGLSGVIYSKWAHTLFIGNGTYDVRFVTGSLRLVNVLNLHLNPTSLFPPAQDVSLVE